MIQTPAVAQGAEVFSGRALLPLGTTFERPCLRVDARSLTPREAVVAMSSASAPRCRPRRASRVGKNLPLSEAARVD